MRRQSFSLVEIMIACMIMVIAAGACYFRFKDSYNDRQNKQVISLIKDTLRRASSYAQMTNSQVLVLFIDTPRGKEIALSSDLKGSAALKIQSANREKLPGVVELQIDSDAMFQENGRIEIPFYPWGGDYKGNALKVRFDQDDDVYLIKLDQFAAERTREGAYSTLYPKEVLDDEKEAKSVRTH